MDNFCQNSLNELDSSKSIESPTKNRVQRYCPRLKDILLKLECEWENCNEIYSNMDDFMGHIDGHLENLRQVDCKWRMCDSDEITSEDDLKRHVRFHAFHSKLKEIGVNVLKSIESRNKSLKAPECTIDDQKRNSIPEVPLNFQCAWEACDYTTDNIELFYRHIRQVHVEAYSKTFPANGIKCPWSDCELMINSRFRLGDHIRSHSVEKLVACPNCGTLFSTFSKFIDHCNRSRKIKDNDLRYQCTICRKIFATNTLLKDHMRKHINKFKCPICEMRCIDKYDLNKHILYKHSKEKPFQCEFCNYCCKTPQDLKKHFSLVHTERDEYSCTQCEFKTKDVNNLRRHFVKFHLPNNTDSPVIENDSGMQFSSSYMCHVCNKIYSTGATLTRHLKVQHNIQWQSGYSRFRYKLDSDGYYRLQTVRYDSIELVEKLNRQQNQQDTKVCQNAPDLIESDIDTDVLNSFPTQSYNADEMNDADVNLAFGQLINVIEHEFAERTTEPSTSMSINKPDEITSTSTTDDLNSKLEDNHQTDSIDLENIFNSSFNFICLSRQSNNNSSSFEAMQF